MADLTVNVKGAGNRSLDHPNFGDVYKTTYRKMVITEIEQTDPDDPYSLLPRAKVREGEGAAESAFIPIFYRPKASFWNDSTHNATDFDEENKYYYKSWQSFRVGDEVSVQCREGIPFRIMAFTDRYPRPGEEVVKFVCTEPFWWKMHRQEWQPNETGPDGYPLHLDKEAELISDVHGPDNLHDELTPQSFTNVCTLNTEIVELEPIDDPLFKRFEGGIQKNFTRTNDTTWNDQKLWFNYRVQMHLFTVGPILYLIVTMFKGNWRVENIPGSYYEDPETGWGMQCSTYDFCIWPFGDCSEENPAHYDDCPEVTANAEAEVAAHNSSYSLDELSTEGHEVGVMTAMHIYAAQYTKELYDDLKANPPEVDWEETPYLVLSPEPPTGMKNMEDMKQTIVEYLYYEKNRYIEVNGSDGINFKVRPHTKQELEDAGLWPGGTP